jgi:5-methylthioadenosine/S-adenosylhomocysteine deaminase
MARTLIENGYVVTMNGARDVWPGGYVAIDGSRIEYAGATRPPGQFGRVLDARRMIVVPGLINAHQHFYYHLFKGAANGLLIEDWFPELVFPVVGHLNDDDMELTAWLAGIEMLTSGTTCCLHHLRTTSSEETLRRLTSPTVALGLRQMVGKEFQCRLPGNPRHPRNLQEETEHLEALIPSWRDAHDGLVRLCLVVEGNAVFIDQQVTSEELIVAGHRLAAKHGLKISTHIAAGTLSFDKSYMQVLRKTGRSEVQGLAQLGVLDDSFVLAHGINLTASDIELIADAGASVVYTPTSEAVRGGGIGPAAALAAAGANVALGSDGPMVDYSVDMVEQMKACSLLQNAKHLNPGAMPPERCLELATIGAAKALGLDDEIGSLEQGKLADIAVFDLSTPQAMPANNPISALVYSARGRDAHTVFVNGREVVSEFKLTAAVDVPAICERAQARATEIISLAGLRRRVEPRWPHRQNAHTI